MAKPMLRAALVRMAVVMEMVMAIRRATARERPPLPVMRFLLPVLLLLSRAQCRRLPRSRHHRLNMSMHMKNMYNMLL